MEVKVELLDKADFAARLGVNVSTLERWMAQRKIEPDWRTPGGSPRFTWPPSDVVKALGGVAG